MNQSKWIKVGGFLSKINSLTKVSISISFKMYQVHKEILQTLHLFRLSESHLILSDLRRKLLIKKEFLHKLQLKTKIKNRFIFLNSENKQILTIVLLKELKNKEVRNLLIFLISVVFRINLKVKILLHNFQDLTTKIMKRKRQILTHFK